MEIRSLTYDCIQIFFIAFLFTELFHRIDNENKRKNTENDGEKNDKKNSTGGNIFNRTMIHLGCEEEKAGEEENNREVCLSLL